MKRTTTRSPDRRSRILAAIEHAGNAGALVETIQPTAVQEQIFDAVGIKAPPRFLDITPA